MLSRYHPLAVTPAQPLLAILIPTWTGGSQLAAPLSHLRDFREGLEFATEIVSVDDASEISTARIASAFADENEATVVLRNEVNRGKGHAVTRGMLHATG